MDKKSSKVDGVILAAGFGSRLRPLTETVPKAAVEIAGNPLIYYALKNMINAGVGRVVINTHYLSDIIMEKVRQKEWPFEVIFSHEPEILGTGGGIQKALVHLPNSDAILVQNADALIEFNVSDLINKHLSHRPISTMLLKTVSNPQEYGVVVTDSQDQVKDINSQLDYRGEVFNQRMFCGMQVFSPEIIDRMPQDKSFFCILKDVIIPAIGAGDTVLGVENNAYFCDVGTFKRLKDAEMYLTAQSREKISSDRI